MANEPIMVKDGRHVHPIRVKIHADAGDDGFEFDMTFPGRATPMARAILEDAATRLMALFTETRKHG